MNNNHNMVPAPYKVSNPVGAEKVKAIDANILGKESWILGQCGNYYNTTQQRSFNNPKMDVQVMNNDRLAAKQLRAKVSGTSIKVDPSSSVDKILGFQTNSGLVHRSLGEIVPVDKVLQK